MKAPLAAAERSRRPKRPKLACGRLAAQVAEWLEEFWSPEELSRRFRIQFPDDPMMGLSHETIYESLFVQGRGEQRRELQLWLRSGQARRRSRNRLEKRNGTLRDMVMISESPAQADDRAVSGHWEGDLILGKNATSAVATLVERSTRCLMLFTFPMGRRPGS